MTEKEKIKLLKRLVDHQTEVIAVFGKDGEEYPRHGYLRYSCDCIACRKAGKKYWFQASLSIVIPFVRYINASDIGEITEVDETYHMYIE